jgi:hypothetical protein
LFYNQGETPICLLDLKANNISEIAQLATISSSKSYRKSKKCMPHCIKKKNSLILIGSKMSPKMVLRAGPKNPHSLQLNQSLKKKKSSMRTLKDTSMNNKMRVSSAEKEPLILFTWAKQVTLKTCSIGDHRCNMEYSISTNKKMLFSIRPRVMEQARSH